MLRQSWLTSSSEHSNVPLRGVSECTTRPVIASSVGVGRQPGDLDVAEAVEREARLEDLAARRRARMYVSSWRAPSAGSSRCSEPSGSSISAKRSCTARAALALDGAAAPSRPCSGRGRTTCTPGARSVTATGRSSSVTRIGCARSGTSGDVVARAHAHRVPAGAVVARLGPRAELAARVVALAHQQVGVHERPGRRPPAAVGGDRPCGCRPRARGAARTGARGRGRSGCRAGAGPSRRTPRTSRRRGSRRGRSRPRAPAPVTSWARVLDALAVVRPAGREHRVADAGAVELRARTPRAVA